MARSTTEEAVLLLLEGRVRVAHSPELLARQLAQTQPADIRAFPVIGKNGVEEVYLRVGAIIGVAPKGFSL